MRYLVLRKCEVLLQPVYVAGFLEWTPRVLAGDMHLGQQNRNVSFAYIAGQDP